MLLFSHALMVIKFVDLLVHWTYSFDVVHNDISQCLFCFQVIHYSMPESLEEYVQVHNSFKTATSLTGLYVFCGKK